MLKVRLIMVSIKKVLYFFVWFCYTSGVNPIGYIINSDNVGEISKLHHESSASADQKYDKSMESVDCNTLKGLSAGQLNYCQLYQDHMDAISRGVKSSLAECKWQFRNQKWNCSTPDGDELFLGPNFPISSREAAFTKAIIAAGLVYSISRACREGHLMTCSCSKAGRPINLQKDWIWGGCTDNMKYGYRFVQGFLDVKEREKPRKKLSKNRARSLANIHNYEAGRRIVSKISHVTCKCHGVSGSCSLVTCWQQLPSFREIGDYLKTKYNAATRVKINRKGRLQIKDPRFSLPTVYDLVYVDESPNYCIKNSTIGSSGTEGRVCNQLSSGTDGCNSLCCGRGYNTKKITSIERCECRFHWCCSVECNTCLKTIETHTCK